MTDYTELLERLDKLASEYTADLYKESAEAIRALQEQLKELEEQLKYKQGQYDSMFRTMVEAGKKIIKLESQLKNDTSHEFYESSGDTPPESI